MKSVIYLIKNLIDNKIYIGSTKNFTSRKYQHKSKLRKNKHSNIYLQRAFNKYGEENFEFIILDIVESSNLLIKEQYYLDNMNPDYNICKIAGTRTNVSFSHTKEAKEKISKSLIGNNYSKNKRNALKVTKEIYYEIMTLKERGLGCRKIAKILNLNKTTIQNVFKNKYNYGRD